MEDCVDQFLMELICFSGIEQGVIDVRCPVIKGREKEAKLRRRHDLPLGAAVKLIFPWEKAQLHLPVLYRADRADNVLEYLVGAVSLGLTILSPVRNIVCVMRQKDQIIALSHIQAFDHLLIKGIPGRSILQGGRPELREQPVLRAIHHLFGGKDNINQVFPQCPGQCLFQKAKIFFGLLLGHLAQGLVQVGDDFPSAVDVAAVHTAYRASIRAETAAKLAKFFLIHKRHIPIQVYFQSQRRLCFLL